VAIKSENECWPWIGYKDKDGYGTFNPKSKILIKAHRFSWALSYGKIPDGMGVLHKCDNPSCCNPRHMFLGTPTDNDLDRDQKGRQARGERSGNSKLKESDIIEIRKLYDMGYSQEKISIQFGVSQTTISSIMTGRTWFHNTASIR
jgi:hypothetical protein